MTENTHLKELIYDVKNLSADVKRILEMTEIRDVGIFKPIRKYGIWISVLELKLCSFGVLWSSDFRFSYIPVSGL